MVSSVEILQFQLFPNFDPTSIPHPFLGGIALNNLKFTSYKYSMLQYFSNRCYLLHLSNFLPLFSFWSRDALLQVENKLTEAVFFGVFLGMAQILKGLHTLNTNPGPYDELFYA